MGKILFFLQRVPRGNRGEESPRKTDPVPRVCQRLIISLIRVQSTASPLVSYITKIRAQQKHDMRLE